MRRFLVLGNLALIAWIFLAFLGVWLYNELYGWLLLFSLAALVYLALRRLGCSSCYYCKSCTSGFGRLTGSFFGSGFTKKSSVGNRIGFIAFIFFLLGPLPAVTLIFSLTRNFSAPALADLICVLALSIYSTSTWVRKKQTSRQPCSDLTICVAKSRIPFRPSPK